MIRGTEDRARTAYKLLQEGLSVRQACKQCNISKSFLKSFIKQQEAMKRPTLPFPKKNTLLLGEMPTLAAPVIEFNNELDLTLEEEDKTVEQQDLFTNAAEHDAAVLALKEKYERQVNLALGIAKYRSNKNMTQRDFAKSCGIGESTLAQYESGTVEFETGKRQVRMVYARMNMTEDDIIEFGKKDIKHRTKGEDKIRMNVANRLGYTIPDQVIDSEPELEPEQTPIQSELVIYDRTAEFRNKQLEQQVIELTKENENLRVQNKNISTAQQGADKRRIQAEKENTELQEQVKSLKAIVKENEELVRKLRYDLSIARQPNNGLAGNEELMKKDAIIRDLERRVARYENIIDRQLAK